MIALLSLSARKVTIGAALGFVHAGVVRVGFVFPSRTTANGVRHVGAERDAAHPVAADRLLLRVDRFTVGVVAGDVNRTAASRGTNPIAGHVSVAGEHEDVVTQCLEVVAGSVSRHVAVVVQFGRLDVGSLRQVAPEAARVPRTVASDAGHVFVAMGTLQQVLFRCPTPLQMAIVAHPNGFCRMRTRIVIFAARPHGLGRLFDLPVQIGFDGTALD